MTQLSGSPAVAGWIYYDANCRWCRLGRRRIGRLFSSRGFRWVPLQSPGAEARLGVPACEFDRRLHLLDATGRVHPNAEALALLCCAVPWLRPLGILLGLPGCRVVARWVYDFIARHRYCGTGSGWRDRVRGAGFEMERGTL